MEPGSVTKAVQTGIILRWRVPVTILRWRGCRSREEPSEPGISAEARLAHWDRSEDLASAMRLPQGRYLYCPDGSHLAMYDDQAVYFAGLIDFLHGLEGS